jgi:hypothetical protein
MSVYTKTNASAVSALDSNEENQKWKKLLIEIILC